MISDVKVIAKESCIPQHKLIIGKVVVKEWVKRKKPVFRSKCKLWKLKEPKLQREFRTQVEKVRNGMDVMEKTSVETAWLEMKNCLMGVAEEICGRTKGKPKHTETWWWNEDCAKAVEKKKILFYAME
jgi:hypothetical protein